MDKKLQTILRQVVSIQCGLLRFRHREDQQNLLVKVVQGDDDTLHCCVTSDIGAKVRVRNKTVHLVQKHHDDYFFIAGKIVTESAGNPRLLSIEIYKATWFTRQRKGSVTWMREKCCYFRGEELTELAIAS